MDSSFNAIDANDQWLDRKENRWVLSTTTSSTTTTTTTIQELSYTARYVWKSVSDMVLSTCRPRRGARRIANRCLHCIIIEAEAFGLRDNSRKERAMRRPITLGGEA